MEKYINNINKSNAVFKVVQDLSIDELFYLSQNPENIIIINRCGLSEILYRLNVKSKIIVYHTYTHIIYYY